MSADPHPAAEPAPRAGPEPTILVAPHSPWRELVVLGILLLDLGLLATMRANAMDRRPSGPVLHAYEMESTELSADERLLFQALLGSVSDVTYEKELGPGGWPSPLDLRQALVPPFDTAFLPAHLRGLGVEQPASAPAFSDYLFRPRGIEGVEQDMGEEQGMGVLVLRIIDREATPDPFFHPHPHEPRAGEEGRFGVQIWRHSEPAALHTGADLVRGDWRWVVSSPLSDSASNPSDAIQ